VITLVALNAALAADPLDLADALDIDPADLSAATVAGDAVASEVLGGLGVIVPHQGADMAALSTGTVGGRPQPGDDLGPIGPAGDHAVLHLELAVPSTAHSFRLDFDFLSAEYPEFVGSSFNDRFSVLVSGAAWSGNAAIDAQGNPININSVLFTVTRRADLDGTGFEGVGGATGWLTVVVPVTPGDHVTVDLDVKDVSDGTYDSTVLLDGFEWSSSGLNEPVVLEDIHVDWLTPKRGPVDGSVQTTIVGSKFGYGCTASFDGFEAATELVDPEHLLATPPPHGAGLVDVEVACPAVSDVLVGGWTYFDTPAGNVPPRLDAITPFQVPLAGGLWVTAAGDGFTERATVTVDGVDVPANVLSPTAIELEAPPHAAGLADVVITNRDGLETALPGGLFYVDTPAWPPVDTAMDTAPPGDFSGGGCASAPASGLLALPWLLLAVRRRR
jgi:hypothetical protein